MYATRTYNAGRRAVFLVCNAARSPHSRHRLCQRCCRPVSRTKSKPPTTSAGHGRPYNHTAQQHRADADVLCPASPSASTTTNHQHRTTYTCHSYHIRHMRHTPYTTTNQPHKDEPTTTPNLKQGRARFNSQAIGWQGGKKAVGPVWVSRSGVQQAACKPDVRRAHPSTPASRPATPYRLIYRYSKADRSCVCHTRFIVSGWQALLRRLHLTAHKLCPSAQSAAGALRSRRTPDRL